eukprot:COSAG04_NODE_851_length_9869_cov_12.480450_2_plen_175_part_00
MNALTLLQPVRELLPPERAPRVGTGAGLCRSLQSEPLAPRAPPQLSAAASDPSHQLPSAEKVCRAPGSPPRDLYPRWPNKVTLTLQSVPKQCVTLKKSAHASSVLCRGRSRRLQGKTYHTPRDFVGGPWRVNRDILCELQLIPDSSRSDQKRPEPELCGTYASLFPRRVQFCQY